jgi:hypothetical protein
MANKQPDTSSLKTGNHHQDPIRFAKQNKGHYANTAQHVEVHKAPQSSRPEDGNLGDSYDDKGPMTHRPMDVVAKRNSYTGPDGSKR